MTGNGQTRRRSNWCSRCTRRPRDGSTRRLRLNAIAFLHCTCVAQLPTRRKLRAVDHRRGNRNVPAFSRQIAANRTHERRICGHQYRHLSAKPRHHSRHLGRSASLVRTVASRRPSEGQYGTSWRLTRRDSHPFANKSFPVRAGEPVLCGRNRKPFIGFRATRTRRSPIQCGSSRDRLQVER